MTALDVAARFVDAINRRDLDALSALMSDDHTLTVFGEEPLVGKGANTEAWRGYFDSFPAYVIFPHDVAEQEGVVAIVGHTTGSHLGLPDDEESAITLIWLATVAGELVTGWALREDTPENRQTHGLGRAPA